MASLKVRVNRLIREMSFVKADLEYHREEHQTRREAFHEDWHKYLEETGMEINLDKATKNMVDVYKPQPVVEAPNLTEHSGKLLKEIAKKTHPDVVEEEVKNEMFKKAAEAKEKNDWFSLYEIAADLGIKADSFTEHHISWLKMEVAKVKSIITAIQTTLEWKYCEPNANKQQILTTYSMATCVSKKTE